MVKRKFKPLKSSSKPTCGLCGKRRNLTKTDCCDHWICDDEDNYVIFSYARNSCYRNHDHNTLCAHHHHEEHASTWQDCAKRKSDFETEMYVWYGTNEFNFEKLPNPPTYEPTKCSTCGEIIVLSEGGYSMRGKQYFCEECSFKRMTNSPQAPKD